MNIKRSHLKKLIKEIVKQSLIKEVLVQKDPINQNQPSRSDLDTGIMKAVNLEESSHNDDPTKEQMLAYLGKTYGREEGFADDAEVAMYWFASFYHGGQSSNLYSVLSTSRFSPGHSARGPEKNSVEEMMYEDLVTEFAKGSDEANEFEKKHASLNEGISITPKNQALIEKWIHEMKDMRKVAVRIIDSVLRVSSVGLTSADLPDSATFANGLDEISALLTHKDYKGALEVAYQTAKEMIEEEGGENLMETGNNKPKSFKEGRLKSLAAAGLVGAAALHNPHAGKMMGKLRNFLQPQTTQNPTQALSSEKNMDAWQLSDKYATRNDDVAQKTAPFVKKYLSGEIKENETEDPSEAYYVEYVSDLKHEPIFTLSGKRFQYCKGKYPNGKEDIAVYSFGDDLALGYKAFKKKYNLP